MGGKLNIHLNAKRLSKEDEIISYVITRTKELVDIFNFFDENSLISQLNKNKQIDYNPELAFLLERSLEMMQISNGKFNVFLGEDILKRKTNLDSSQIQKHDYKNSIKIGHDKIEILNPHIKIDHGGIAKGYILDRVLEDSLEKFNSDIVDLLIDARGDIVSFGKNKKIIEIENPFNPDTSFEELQLKKCVIVTSGHNRQYFKDGSHILGNESDIKTITLKSDKRKCFEIDALATYLIQLSSEEVLEKMNFDEYFDDIDALLILQNGKVLKSVYW